MTCLFQVHWLFRVGVHEHQEVYDREREAMQSAERLLFTLFSEIADDQQWQLFAAVILPWPFAALNVVGTGRAAKTKITCTRLLLAAH